MENVMVVVILKKELSTQEAADVIERIRETKGVLVAKTIEAVVNDAFPALEALDC
jgi:hypothetical protein